MKQPAKALSRRKFLLTGGAAVVTAAALAVRPSRSGLSEKKSDGRGTRGYHASEHIDNYYRTTKV